uniref:Uncharacterized protein n=1 Tax=Myoviridae sp. ct3wi9 TaxID=2826610 RepID=A0A8S5MWK5_9CAUD|nr:MAG TPA: hypothetical protein [Myoviridae sp. ct3wi9]DAI05034.1 MAG TPA: hypothetical protein [Caudoviricetes sp.]DAN54965.1 MAG TPA: hypothetical protein [Caudoviricetes sp.]DAO40804.1 MAG TPA: hypothetical protein [Bacteriophage sp.]DAP00593.1 MAG TPA: hypothetical protein [Caudoviricetes sp.]
MNSFIVIGLKAIIKSLHKTSLIKISLSLLHIDSKVTIYFG